MGVCRTYGVALVAGGILSMVVATGTAAAQETGATVTVEECLALMQDMLGGEALHLEFESRGGVPTYEFVIGTDEGEYYVGCDGTTGLIGEIDLIVEAQDPRWTALAKVDEAAAIKAATERY
jgi:hypothetical protein